MKNVSIKSSLLLLVILLLSCHNSVKNKKNIIINVDNVKLKNLTPIVTNSLDSNFVYDLIETQKVQKGDTVLFRKWGTGTIDKKPILINNDKTKYEVFGDSIVEFYKTGMEKFSTHKITVSNNLNDNTLSFYGITILNKDKDAYAMSQPSSLVKVKKLSRTLGRLDFSCEAFDEFYVDFKLKNNLLYIQRLSSLSYSYSETYKYKLDTLIVIKNNGFINAESLYFSATREKNRVKKFKDYKILNNKGFIKNMDKKIRKNAIYPLIVDFSKIGYSKIIIPENDWCELSSKVILFKLIFKNNIYLIKTELKYCKLNIHFSLSQEENGNVKLSIQQETSPYWNELTFVKKNTKYQLKKAIYIEYSEKINKIIENDIKISFENGVYIVE